MDKKSKYMPSTAKGAAPGDAKKTQDVVNGSKVFPKTTRRRETPGGGATFGGKNEQQSRKSALQKARSFDKRPKPKGRYHGGAKEDTKVVDKEAAELGSVTVQGKKKQNMNHLLNFHYARRDVPNGSGSWNYGRPYGNNNRWLPPVQRRKYNKEQFLQANCQFVVNDDGDYTAYLSDPDTLVDWNLIEQIRIHTSENLSCPICLFPPVAGKMTRCGHVYCWPCILHHLALSENSWRECPICYEFTRKTDLKSVVEVTQLPLNIGDHVRLRLMRRERGSLIAVPVQEPDDPAPSNFVALSDHKFAQIYSKLLLANIRDVRDIIDNERAQLRRKLEEDSQSSENYYIEEALAALSAREQNVAAVKVVKSDPGSLVGVGSNEPRKIAKQVTEAKNEPQGNSESCQRLPDPKGSAICAKGSDIVKDEANAEGPRALSKFFYFYQAEDGQHLYLHAMNVQMLEHQYGALENCPREIWGRIVEKEVGSFTEELRRRMRYLCHLPLTCQYEIAEIELAPPLITEEVLSCFAEQMDNRKKRRRRREREERKREKKINAEENKRMGKFPTPRVHIESHKHFPEWQPESQFSGISVPSPPESVAPSSVASSPSRGSYVEDNAFAIEDYNGWHAGSVNSVDQQQFGTSFAEMLRNTGSRAGSNTAWPSIGTSDSAKNSRISELPVLAAEDTYTAAPSYNCSFGDALAQAFHQTEFLDAAGENNEASSAAGKKKKKKKKATILFATSMSRTS